MTERLPEFAEVTLMDILDRTAGKPFFLADLYGSRRSPCRRCVHRLADAGFFSRITINRDGHDLQAYHPTRKAWAYADQHGLLAKQEAGK